MQFGFKANHYLKNGSNVYSCLLDASKSFDKIDYGKLFRILPHKKFLFVLSYYY